MLRHDLTRLARSRACAWLAACCLGIAAVPAWPQVPPDSAAAETPPRREGQRIDDRRRDDPTTVDLFGRPVELTGSWEYTDERRRNFDLDLGSARDRRVREHEVKLEARTRPGPGTEVFLQMVGLHETRRTEGDADKQVRRSLERGQTWVRLDPWADTAWALQAGRVALIDRRAWWWDDDLDAVRLSRSGEAWQLDTGLARELARVSSAEPGVAADQRGVTRWWGQAAWLPARRHRLDLFWLLARDGSGRPTDGSTVADEDLADASDFDGHWLGLRASGEFRPDGAPRLAYWLDLASVRGREHRTRYVESGDVLAAQPLGERDVRGHAVDLGATLRFVDLPLKPSLSLAWARGSGGPDDAAVDRRFRQTGLQENKARLGGVKRLRMYGELLSPELSNLSIATVGTSVRWLDNSSLELVAHRYRQPTPSTVLPGSRLAADPAGLDGDIGHELDLVLALREWRQFELTLRWSRFVPGRAFDAAERDAAQAIELGATFNF